ncbi:MAG: hypothetical protein ACK5BE_01065 [Alphaproteobacteria bacterium]|jgi:hypothetical protein
MRQSFLTILTLFIFTFSVAISPICKCNLETASVEAGMEKSDCHHQKNSHKDSSSKTKVSCCFSGNCISMNSLSTLNNQNETKKPFVRNNYLLLSKVSNPSFPLFSPPQA